jgi:hypothetical protein
VAVRCQTITEGMSDDQQRHITVDSEGVDSDTLDDILAATRRSYTLHSTVLCTSD